MDRILIIGIPGAGKSTFSSKLGKALGRKVTHLDKLYHKPGWAVAHTKDAWIELVKDLISKDKWIIDGNYIGTLDLRLSAADTVIYLNFNKPLCLYRVIMRCFKKDPLLGIDKAEGDRNKISWDLIKKIITYPKKEVIQKLKTIGNGKKVFVIDNSKKLDNLLLTLNKDHGQLP